MLPMHTHMLSKKDWISVFIALDINHIIHKVRTFFFSLFPISIPFKANAAHYTVLIFNNLHTNTKLSLTKDPIFAAKMSSFEDEC